MPNSENKPNAVIIGMNTMLSIPPKSFKFGFPDRMTYVLSRKCNKLGPPTEYIVGSNEVPPTTAKYYGIKYCDSFESAVNIAYEDGAGEIFVNGGEEVYKMVLQQYPDYCKRVFVEEMEFQKKYESDKFFPELSEDFEEVYREKVHDIIMDKTTGNTENVSMNFLVFENKKFTSE